MVCFFIIRYVPNPVFTLARLMLERTGDFEPAWTPEVVKGKIVAGDPAELNVLNVPEDTFTDND